MRRKISLLIISLIITLSTVNSQLLAIDFGTQFIKASIVHSGAGKSFSIVENSKSERKFLNALGFYNQQRFYQTDSLTKRTKIPQNCFLYSRMLIDFVKSPSLVKIVKKDLFLEYIKQDLEDQFLAQFILKGFPEETNQVTLLEVMTMILKYVKKQAEKFAKMPIKDVVLILPNYWSIHQRNFLLQAAAVAEIYVLSIVSENTAASINYALSQRTQNKTQNVLFYNVGSNALQMTLVQYKQVTTQSSPKPVQSIFIKDDYGKPYVGGLRLDSIVANFFEQIFQQKYKKKLDKKGLIKLIAQSNKVKQTLTSNKQANLFVQGIMDGIDFHAKMTRAEFQKRAEEVFKQLTVPLKRFLLDNDLKAKDLHSVQLIGGGARIPKLQSMIAEILNNEKQKIGTHINGDQAMALGGAFFAANSSKKFKVKGINLYDGFNFDIRLVLRNLDATIQSSDPKYFYKNATIFKKKSRYGLNKQVNFKCTYNLKAQLYKIDLQTQQQQLLKLYQFDQIEKFNQTDFKLSLIFTIDPLDVVKLKDSKFTYKKDQVQTYLQKVKKLKVKNETDEKKEDAKNEDKEQPGSSAEDSKQENSSEQRQKREQQKINQSQQQSATSQQKQQTTKQPQEQQQQTQEQSESPKDKKGQKSSTNKTSIKRPKSSKYNKTQQKYQYQTVQKNKTVTKKYQKQLKAKQSYNIKKLQQNLNQRTRQMLKNYENAQQKKRTLAESRNKLEAVIYQTNDKLQNEQFIKYSKPSERQHLKKLSEEKQQWHDESTSKNPQDYKKQYNQLHKPLEQIKRRIIEDYQREHIKNRALAIIKEHLNLTSTIQKGKQWITDEEVEELRATLKDAQKKIKQIYQAMQDTNIDQDTTYKNKDMIRQAQTAKDKYFALKAKVKPTVTKKPKQQQQPGFQQISQSSTEQQPKKQQNKKQKEVNSDEL